MTELRDVVEVARWLAGGLALRRIAPLEAGGPPGDGRWAGSDDAMVADAIRACANELPALPPPGVIADIALLLAGARPVIRAANPGDDALRTALVAYDDDVVIRIAATPRFDDVLAACAHAAAGDRPAAVALVVGAVCERARFAGDSVSPAALRRALAGLRDERARLARPGAPDGALAHRFADAYHRLARGARQCRALVDDREVFAVDHLAVLRDLGGRLTAAHIGAAASAIAQRLPRRLPPRRDLRGLRETRLADDTLYPAGGFASITPGGATSGNIENLVVSELIYMDDDEPIDVFALRYVEGELLHYTRDDSVLRRHRHLIGIALGADLDDARVKDRDLPWQRLILALGLVVAAIRWLVEQLGDQALAVHLAFPPRVLAEERQIVALLLEGEIVRGTVEIVEQPWRDTLELAARAARTAVADVVVVSTGDLPEIPAGLRVLHVGLADAAPIVRELAPRRGDSQGNGEPWLAWCDGAEDLLRWLV
jgi:hypothetical protein